MTVSTEGKRPIVVAGKTYASIEEMPAEVRRVYERAVETRTQEHVAARVKLVFNGHEYDSLDSMPPEVRKLYQTQQVAMETYRDFSIDATTPKAAKGSAAVQKRMQSGKAGSKRQMWIALGAVLLLVAILVFIFAK